MVLSVQNLRVQYGARVLFNDLSFTVEDGERIALAGHNGGEIHADEVHRRFE